MSFQSASNTNIHKGFQEEFLFLLFQIRFLWFVDWIIQSNFHSYLVRKATFLMAFPLFHLLCKRFWKFTDKPLRSKSLALTTTRSHEILELQSGVERSSYYFYCFLNGQRIILRKGFKKATSLLDKGGCKVNA